MFCKKCGNSLPDKSKFCPNCGTETMVEAPEEECITTPQNSTVIVEPLREPVPVKQWCFLLLNFIPYIGGLITLVLLIIWAVGDPKNDKYPCRVNFARAALIMFAIIFVITIIAFIFMVIYASTIQQ